MSNSVVIGPENNATNWISERKVFLVPAFLLLLSPEKDMAVLIFPDTDSDSGEGGWNAPTTTEDPTGETPTFDPGDLAFILISTGMVWFMITGLGFYYTGMLRAKNALSLILLSLWSASIVSIQVVWGGARILINIYKILSLSPFLSVVVPIRLLSLL